MNNWKVWIESLKEKPFSALGLLVLLALPVTLLLVFRSQDTRTSAAQPDKLETEGGTLSSTDVTKQSDSGASGGQYVVFNKANAPIPTPTSGGTWGPRSAPPTPTGSNVYTIPSSIDGSGNTNVSSAINNFVNSVPNGTGSYPSIIVFPAGKTYTLDPGILMADRNNLTFWGYGSTIKLIGAGTSSTASSFKMRRSDNIKIFGFRIIGNDPDVSDLSDGQFQMGVAINDDSDYVEVADMHISNVHGDGIFIFVFADPAANDWNFHHNLIVDPGRSGIIVNEGNGRIEYNIIRGPGLASIGAEDQNSSYPENGGNKNLGPVLIANNWLDGWANDPTFWPWSIYASMGTDGFKTINNITIENNLFTRGDLGTLNPNQDADRLNFRGSVKKTNIIIRNNTMDIPVNQQRGEFLNIYNADNVEVNGNVIPDMEIICNSCINFIKSNNQQ